MSDPESMEVLDELPPDHHRKTGPPGSDRHHGQDKRRPGHPGGQRVTLQTPPGSPKPAKPPKPKKPMHLKGRPDRAPGNYY